MSPGAAGVCRLTATPGYGDRRTAMLERVLILTGGRMFTEA